MYSKAKLKKTANAEVSAYRRTNLRPKIVKKLLSPWSQSTFHWASFPQSLLQGMFPSTLHPQSTINLLSTFPTRFSAQFFENPPLDSDSFLTHWHHRAAPCQETESGEWRKLCHLPRGIHWNGQGGDHKKLLQANGPHCLSRTVLQHKAMCRDEREWQEIIERVGNPNCFVCRGTSTSIIPLGTEVLQAIMPEIQRNVWQWNREQANQALDRWLQMFR